METDPDGDRPGGLLRPRVFSDFSEADLRLGPRFVGVRRDASRGRRHDHAHTVRVRAFVRVRWRVWVSVPLPTRPFLSDAHLPVRLGDDDDEVERIAVAREDERFDERDVDERSAPVGVLAECDARGFHRRRPREDGDAVYAVMVRVRELRRAEMAPERRRRGGDDSRRIEKRGDARARRAPKAPGVGDEHASAAIVGR